MNVMTHLDQLARPLPDVANLPPPEGAAALAWCGMDELKMPLSVRDADDRVSAVSATVGAFVNLRRSDVRGIHMSRLYRHVDLGLSAQALTPVALRRVLAEFLDSQSGLSDRAALRIGFDLLLRRPALVSDNSGWRSYPVLITGVLDGDAFTLEVQFETLYSSTCPCSAALARQLIQQQFELDFPAKGVLEREDVLAWLGSEGGIVATPHSQRSAALVRVKLAADSDSFGLDRLIGQVEQSLRTSVQTAVKREDEQAFALLNGANLMFCEDAARRVQAALESDPTVTDFWLRASHYESLHAHDAVAVAVKGIAGGYVA